jgi:hypothetical protein
MTVEADLARAVNSVVQTYVKRCFWVDESDLRQEAWTAAFVAHAHWRPDRGPLERYAYVTIRHAIAAYVVRERAPVSASWHRRHDLIGIGREAIEMTDPETGRTFQRPELASPPESWAEALLADERWKVRVLARLIDLLGSEDDLDALLGTTKKLGRPPRRLVALIEKHKDTIRADEELRAIWEEQPA